MLRTIPGLTVAIGLFSQSLGAHALIPAPNGTYTVGLSILELRNTDSIQPYAPDVEVPDLMLSVFYPSEQNTTVGVPYMDLHMAMFEDQELAQQGLDTTSATFQQLSLQLAAHGSKVAQPETNSGWPVLIFGCAQGTSRVFYSALLSQIASTGYVVIAFDTPYDTDIVFYPDGRNITISNTVTAAFASPETLQQFFVPDFNVRAQDASFIVTSFSNASLASSVIPGCNSCLNTTHLGYFGHSMGGGAGATLLLNDTRIAGAMDWDGAVVGDVIHEGLDKPFMLMATTGQVRDGDLAVGQGTNWARLWPNLRGPSFDLVLNGAAHYDYSDYPLIFELLENFPSNQTVLTSLAITTMNGTRAHHIVTTYTVAFFDWLLKGGPDNLLKAPNPEFPEVSLDTGNTEVFSNGTVFTVENSTVVDSPVAGHKNSATSTSLSGLYIRVSEILLGLLLLMG